MVSKPLKPITLSHISHNPHYNMSIFVLLFNLQHQNPHSQSVFNTQHNQMQDGNLTSYMWWNSAAADADGFSASLIIFLSPQGPVEAGWGFVALNNGKIIGSSFK